MRLRIYGSKPISNRRQYFLEVLLKQERAWECASFLSKLQERNYEATITAFSLFAIALRLEKAGKRDAVFSFLSDSARAGYLVFQPTLENQKEILEICSNRNLDFDDAQQYFAAKELDAVLVSFDADFDKTDLQRLEPKDFLK